MRKTLDKRIEDGTIMALDNAYAPNIYVDIKALEQATAIETSWVKILSPFDNAVIHRDRLSTLFGFDYRIECYVSAPKRVFGYFCLPILYGNKFVGRVDCKAHRADQGFEVITLSLHDDTIDRHQFIPALIEELQRLANFNKCPLLDARVVTA